MHVGCVHTEADALCVEAVGEHGPQDQTTPRIHAHEPSIDGSTVTSTCLRRSIFARAISTFLSTSCSLRSRLYRMLASTGRASGARTLITTPVATAVTLTATTPPCPLLPSAGFCNASAAPPLMLA